MSARLKPYPSYKDSGVDWLGRIPTHWAVSRLGANCSVKARLGWKGLKASEYVRSGFIFLSTPNIKSEAIDFENVKYITAERYAESPEIIIKEGDVLIAKDGSTLGTSNVVRNLPAPATVNSSIAVIRAKSAFDSLFLWRFLCGDYTQNVIQRMKGGMGVPHLFQADLRKFIVLRPPLGEQKTIAVFVDRETGKIDALVRKNERLIELLQEKRTALISHAATKGLNPDAPLRDSGISWIGHIPKHWELKKLGQVARIVRGGSPRPAGDPRFFDGDACPWITVAEITKDSGKFLVQTETRLTEEGRRHSRFLKAGTLVMSNSGATLGVPKILNISGCINDGSVAFLDLNPSVSRNYLYYYLASLTDNYRQRIKQGSGQPNLNTAIVRATWLPIADVAEQVRIVQLLDREAAKSDALMAKVRTAIERLQEYRTALVSAAVTGQIDVRPRR